jgi:DNA topoisomerase IA
MENFKELRVWSKLVAFRPFVLASEKAKKIEDTLSKGLVIVESPAKAKTIQKYLGKGFTVEASLGHVKDLPKSTLGGCRHDERFRDRIHRYSRQGEGSRQAEEAGPRRCNIYLAPDPDREGEAIAWHLASGTGRQRQKKKEERRRARRRRAAHSRVTFNEITKRAVQEAFEHPRDIDQNLVDAQQARRVLDRLVGYQVSPLLWDKVRRGLSAGRVQTVALRLIVEREREIKAFRRLNTGRSTLIFRGQAAGIRRPFLGKGEEKVEVTTAKMRKRSAPRWRRPTGSSAPSSAKSAAAMRRRRSPPASCNRTPRASCASA